MEGIKPRSSKAEEITKQKNAIFVFWNKKLNWQLRVRVNVNLSSNSPEVQRIWQQVKQTAINTFFCNNC